MMEILLVVLKAVLTAGMILAAVLAAAFLGRLADPEPLGRARGGKVERPGRGRRPIPALAGRIGRTSR